MGATRVKRIEAQNTIGLSAPLGRDEKFWIKLHRKEAWLAQGRACIYCLEPLPAEAVTADHILARAAGGTTRRGNIVAACQPCNLLKGTRRPDKFKSMIRNPPADASMPLLWANVRWRIWSRTREAERRLSLLWEHG